MVRVHRLKSFRQRVEAVVRDIPRGRVLSYGEVAKRAGAPGAARAVGTLMRKNTDEGVPCHRVVRSDGSLGEYNRGGEKRKQELLIREGVRMRKGKIVF